MILAIEFFSKDNLQWWFLEFSSTFACWQWLEKTRKGGSNARRSNKRFRAIQAYVNGYLIIDFLVH